MKNRLTWEKPDGEWGLVNRDIKQIPSELYGYFCKLHDYEKTGLSPDGIEILKELQDMGVEKLDEKTKEVECLKEQACQMCVHKYEVMTDEVFELMDCFPNAFINRCGEIILSKKGNVYFTIKGCKTKTDIIVKLLEWCSRPMAKGEPWASEKRNSAWRDELISCLNKYLGTQFGQEEMYWIYDRLGNSANHTLTLDFIESDYDMAMILNN